MTNYNLDVEAYLFNPDLSKRYPLAGSYGYFFVPPTVEVVEDVLPDARDPTPGNRFTRKVPLLCYPVPSSWYDSQEAPQPRRHGYSLLSGLSWRQQPSQEVLESLTPEEHESFQSWEPMQPWYRRHQIDPQPMQVMGWQWQYDAKGMLTQNLLDDVVNLANSDRFTDRCWAAVASFAGKWGPLWLCRTSGHGRCYLPEISPGVWGRDVCTWAPVEEVYAFWRFGWEVKSVLEIGQVLRQGKIASSSLYRHLGFCGESFADYSTLEGHRFFLALEVSLHLNPVRGGLTLNMTWEEKDSYLPTLQLSTMLGIRHAAWMQVAQVLCGAYSILQCDGCSHWYVRSGRRPQTGRQNFCPQCRGKDAEGKPRNLGSKRLYAARRRA